MLSARRTERHVLGGVGVERRIEVNQIDAFGCDLVAENLEVVAIVQGLGDFVANY